MILYGKPVVEAIENEIKEEIKKLADINIQPFLAVILIGDDPASLVYTRKKKEKAESLGMGFRLYHYPATMAQSDIEVIISDLNQNKNVHGIIIQLPLPEGYDTDKLLSLINPEKDVDGLNGGFATPTAGAILELMQFYNIDTKNKKVVLVGRGKLVGQPLEKIFKSQDLDLEVCNSKTEDLKSKTLTADIIVSGVGKPSLITPDMVSEKAIIIDAGTAESSGSTVGDVSSEVYAKVAAYSPVPGGVGPVTVIKLLKNVVESART